MNYRVAEIQSTISYFYAMDKTPVIGPAWLRLVLFIICLIAFGLIFSLAATYLPIENAEPGSYSSEILINVLISIIVSLLTVFLFTRFVDRKKMTDLGLAFKDHGIFAATGFFVALFMLGIGTIILVFTKNLEFVNTEFDASKLYVGLGLMILVAVAEELVFRGYILNTLLSFSNRWVALGISALVFAALHGANPRDEPIADDQCIFSRTCAGYKLYIYPESLVWNDAAFCLELFPGACSGF